MNIQILDCIRYWYWLVCLCHSNPISWHTSLCISLPSPVIHSHLLTHSDLSVHLLCLSTLLCFDYAIRPQFSISISAIRVSALRGIFVEEFQEGNTDVWTTIIVVAMAELRKVQPATTPFNKLEASKVSFHVYKVMWFAHWYSIQKIRKWFYNHYTQPDRQYVKFTHKWSAWNTFYQMCHNEVMIKAEEMSGAPPESQAFLGSLQDATIRLWRALSSNGQKRYENLAKMWSDQAPLPDVQARYVTYQSHSLILV